jgi:hypothetical protein
VARGLVERPTGPLTAPGAWLASQPKVTLRELVDRAETVGAKLGLVVAWRMTGRPIPADKILRTKAGVLDD